LWKRRRCWRILLLLSVLLAVTELDIVGRSETIFTIVSYQNPVRIGRVEDL
jgi:hypothetical protein